MEREVTRRLIGEKLKESALLAVVACVIPILVAGGAVSTLFLYPMPELAGWALVLAPSVYATACVVLAGRISAASPGHVLVSIGLTALVLPAAAASVLFGLIVMAPVVFGLFCGLIVAPCWGQDRSIAVGGLYGVGIWLIGVAFIATAGITTSTTLDSILSWAYIGIVLGAPPPLCVYLALKHHAATRIAAWTNDTCIACGYSLAGLDTQACPECGQAIRSLISKSSSSSLATGASGSDDDAPASSSIAPNRSNSDA